MFWFVRVFVARLTARMSRFCLHQALTLPPRGGVKNDGLHIENLSQQLCVEWNARGIHPWDLDAAYEAKTVKFVEQFLADTEAAIDRIFQALPQINEIAVTVRKPDTGEVLAEGTVERVSKEKQVLASARMRLLARGMKCYLDETYWEGLQLVHG
jgi:hypothetical protein